MLRDLISTFREAFRIYIRQRTRPRTIEEAEERRLFWSKCYASVGILAAITATYLTATRNVNFKYPEYHSKEQAIMDTLAESTTKVYKFQNFKKVEEYLYTPTTVKNTKEPLSESKPAETSKV